MEKFELENSLSNSVETKSFDREEYRKTIEELTQDIPEEKQEKLSIKDINPENFQSEEEMMKAVDHNFARLFNYFDNKEVNKDSHENLKNLLGERMQKEKEYPLDWSHQTFNNVNLSGIEFTNAKLNNTYFGGKHSDLRRVIFNGVNVSHSTFEEIQKMTGIEFANLRNQNRLMNVYFHGVFMNNSIFREVDAEKLNFVPYEKVEKNNPEETMLNDLSGSIFSSCNFMHLNMKGTDLNHTKWKETNIRHSVFDKTTLHKSKFDQQSYEEFTKNTQLAGGYKFDIEVA